KSVSYTLDGRRMRQSLNVRSYVEALKLAEQLEKKLCGMAEVTPEKIKVSEAVQLWLDSREKDGLKNEKAKLMGKKLLEFCGWEYDEEISKWKPLGHKTIIFISSITPADLQRFYGGLTFSSGKDGSSSLKIHWAVMGALFNWCVGAGHLTTNPMLLPNGKK